MCPNSVLFVVIWETNIFNVSCIRACTKWEHVMKCQLNRPIGISTWTHLKKVTQELTSNKYSFFAEFFPKRMKSKVSFSNTSFKFNLLRMCRFRFKKQFAIFYLIYTKTFLILESAQWIKWQFICESNSKPQKKQDVCPFLSAHIWIYK